MAYARAPVDLLDGLPTTSLPVFSTDGPAAPTQKLELSPQPPPPSKALAGAKRAASDSDDDQSEEEREKRLKDLQDQVGSP